MGQEAIFKQYEDFYEQIGISREMWPDYSNPYDFAEKLLNNEKSQDGMYLSTVSDHITMSKEIVESMIYA